VDFCNNNQKKKINKAKAIKINLAVSAKSRTKGKITKVQTHISAVM
jgi:hypothetical protein